MSDRLYTEVFLKKKLIHSKEIFNKMSIGRKSSNNLIIESLNDEEFIFRKDDHFYSIQFLSDQWKINKKKSTLNKVYLINDKTVIKNDIIEVKFLYKSEQSSQETVQTSTTNQNIKSTSTSTKSIKDLLSEADHVSNLPETDSKKSQTKKLKDTKKEKAKQTIGIISNLSTFLFDISVIYSLYYYILPLSNDKIISKYTELLETKLTQISLSIITNESVKNYLQKIASTIPSSILKIPLESVFLILTKQVTIFLKFYLLYFAFQIITSALFGRRFSYLLIGINTDDSFFIKRFKSVLKEILSVFLAPLSILNLGGIIPIRSLPELLTRTNYIKYSLLAQLIFPPLLIIFSLSFFVLPSMFSFNTFDTKVIISTAEKSKKVHKNPKVESLNFSASQNIQIPIPKELSFSREVKKDLEYYKITGVNNKNSLSIKPYPRIDLSKYKVNFLLGNPATFITHPATTIEHYSTKVKNLVEKQRHSEVSSMIKKSFQINIENIYSIITSIGPFTHGPLTFRNNILDELKGRNIEEITFFQLSDIEYVIFSSGSEKIIQPINSTEAPSFLIHAKNYSFFLKFLRQSLLSGEIK